jgi:hypothetical protein
MTWVLRYLTEDSEIIYMDPETAGRSLESDAVDDVGTVSDTDSPAYETFNGEQPSLIAKKLKISTFSSYLKSSLTFSEFELVFKMTKHLNTKYHVFISYTFTKEEISDKDAVRGVLVVLESYMSRESEVKFEDAKYSVYYLISDKVFSSFDPAIDDNEQDEKPTKSTDELDIIRSWEKRILEDLEKQKKLSVKTHERIVELEQIPIEPVQNCK